MKLIYFFSLLLTLMVSTLSCGLETTQEKLSTFDVPDKVEVETLTVKDDSLEYKMSRQVTEADYADLAYFMALEDFDSWMNYYYSDSPSNYLKKWSQESKPLKFGEEVTKNAENIAAFFYYPEE